jgi:inosose dehydratase
VAAAAVRIANAPLSYGAFEVTVGVYPNVPGAEELLAEMARAGYAGTELGPPGYLGEGLELRERLERHGLGMAGGFVPIHFSEPDRWEEDFRGLDRTLELFAAAGDAGARPVLADAGSPERVANPGRGKDMREIGLDDAGWRRLAEGVKRAEERSRERGFEPTFHHHGATYVEAPWEIERLMELTDVGVLLDTGHLLLGGGDPIAALREWGPRVNHVHAKDVRLGVLEDVVAERADMLEAWARGVFCPLGEGDVDLPAFFRALGDSGYEGWVVVEQDRIPREDEPLSESAADQAHNRTWLREHAGL